MRNVRLDKLHFFFVYIVLLRVKTWILLHIVWEGSLIASSCRSSCCRNRGRKRKKSSLCKKINKFCFIFPSTLSLSERNVEERGFLNRALITILPAYFLLSSQFQNSRTRIKGFKNGYVGEAKEISHI